ncbi:MAG: hypothetical protein QXR89_00135 [Candidatus Bathyarchaeia archaeon]
MDKKKLSAIALIMAIALSAFGFVYAAWKDYIYIEGTIKMGSLTLAFDYFEPPKSIEYWLNHTSGQLVEGEFEGKDVGYCSSSYKDLITDPHTGKKGYKTLVILVENAYPQYYVHTTFVLHNIGTVPIDIAKYEITGEKKDKNGTLIYNLLWYDPDGDYIGSLYEDVNNNGKVDDGDIEVINLKITNKLPYQIDPCNVNKAEIDMDFKQAAEECHTYLIHVRVVGIQWNKVAEVTK